MTSGAKVQHAFEGRVAKARGTAKEPMASLCKSTDGETATEAMAGEQCTAAE